MSSSAVIVILCFVGLASIGAVVLIAYAITALSVLMDAQEDIE